MQLKKINLCLFGSFLVFMSRLVVQFLSVCGVAAKREHGAVAAVGVGPGWRAVAHELCGL